MDIYSNYKRSKRTAKGFFEWSKNKKVKLWKGLLALAASSLFLFVLIWQLYPRDISPPDIVYSHRKISHIEGRGFVPGPLNMKKMKTKGCVADGILSDYGSDRENSVALINRSNCMYLHRALETWAAPPDFDEAQRVMEKIDKPGIIYGMFISEAIWKKARYYYSDEKRYFDFSEMCRSGSDNVWGEHTCKPSFKKKEYQEYVRFITRRAMDMGIQSFLFGQIYYQDTPDHSESNIPEIIKEMKDYANEKGIQIAVGAQTGAITDEKYLRFFDYIEGGVGMGDDGKIESGPCWSHLESCWGLLWHENFSKKANNVILHLDWSGLKFDDMSVFARMSQEKRIATLKELHSYFTSRQMGFMMPMMATINKTNGGCYGPKKRFYSADNKYKCKDEDAINAILGKE